MPSFIDLTNQRFGSLQVIKRAPNQGKETCWECQCDCGAIKIIGARHLRSGTSKSCGECSLNKFIGTQHNNWLVLEKTNEIRKGTYSRLFKCKCVNCGHISYKTKGELRSHVEQGSQICRHCNQDSLTGKEFGLLYVHSQAVELTTPQTTYWNCKCICGEWLVLSYGELVSHHISSCKNCQRKSRGEYKVEQLLSLASIKYETQKTFSTCRYEDSQCLARFDFYLPEYNIIIEYDGEQHFRYSGSGWYTEEYWNKRKQKDEYKTKWCQENNIPLIRIPYTEYENLSIEMIQSLIQEKAK